MQPPGAGKTYLVKQMSNVCEMPLYGVHTNQVRGAPAVRKLFDQARDNYPSLVFMDDVDAIFSNHDDEPSCPQNIQQIRDELFTQLGPRKLKIIDPKSSKNPTDAVLGGGGSGGSVKMNGVSSNSRASSRASTVSQHRPSAPPDEDEDVFDDEHDSAYPDNNGIIVVAATSAPWLLYKDHELLSRFRGVYLVGLPDKQTRYTLLRALFTDLHHNLTDKDIMLVAEKTEGFTPADLMVVVKTLTYRQFSLLLSLASAHTASVGSSSDVGSTGSQTPLSSEISETASESDLDGLPESEGHMKRGVVAAAALAAAAAVATATNAKPPANTTSPLATETPTNAASGAVPKKDLRQASNGNRKAAAAAGVVAAVTAAAVAAVAAVEDGSSVAALGDDWNSDTEESHRLTPRDTHHTQVECEGVQQQAPTRVTEDLTNSAPASPTLISPAPASPAPLSIPSPDSALGLSKSSEEIQKEDGLPSTPHPASETSGVVSSGCESSDGSGILDEVEREVTEKEEGGDSDTDREEAREEENMEVGVCNDGDGKEGEEEEVEKSVIHEDKEKRTCGEGDVDSIIAVSDEMTEDNHYDSGSGTGNDNNIEVDTHDVDAENYEEFGNNLESVENHPTKMYDNVESQPEVNDEVEKYLEMNDDRSECASGGDESRVGTPGTFELHYDEPPEPMRDDNCAIDSDSDDEGAVVDVGRTRGRRVAFSGLASALEPLSVDVGDSCGPPNVSLDDLPPNITLAPSSLPEPMLAEDRHQDAAPNAILLSLLARPTPSRSDRRLDHSPEMPFLHSDPDVNKTSTPITPLGSLSASPDLPRTPDMPRAPIDMPRTLTPTPSEGSSNNGTIGSSGSGSGARASPASTSSQVHHKKENSDSSFDHSDGQTVPSSDISTATCNDTGETLECRTDSEERLQGLEDEASDRQNPDQYPLDPPSRDEAKAAGAGLSSLFNLDDLGDISIQLITLADVLEVVGKGYRSVTDEEIKRYTDFMVWFSNVAKSACPHSKDGSHKPNAPHLDDISLDSTVYDTPSLAKKRKGPLRKLGRFLLKALMFILD
ncbi:hypothetical protein Pcinc_022233 [Petrolisthes cinctipes]|uniref:ATPase AAA-type core domain-containing protein n=1 Tax=Petrolisthes cinctipes TaxID=88211 RepID=A0AAE1FE20_PETCI|nr:hypothetical protein Pcinc_022233 [Petrolisthes cinctipes]